MKSSHEDLKNILPEYRNGSLPEEAMKTIEAHVSGCEECRAELALISMLADTSVPEPEPGFWADLNRAVAASVESRHRRKPALGALRALTAPFPLAVAVCVVFLFITAYIYTRAMSGADPVSQQAFFSALKRDGQMSAADLAVSSDNQREDLLAYSDSYSDSSYYSDVSGLSPEELDDLYHKLDSADPGRTSIAPESRPGLVTGAMPAAKRKPLFHSFG